MSISFYVICHYALIIQVSGNGSIAVKDALTLYKDLQDFLRLSDKVTFVDIRSGAQLLQEIIRRTSLRSVGNDSEVFIKVKFSFGSSTVQVAYFLLFNLFMTSSQGRHIFILINLTKVQIINTNASFHAYFSGFRPCLR